MDTQLSIWHEDAAAGTNLTHAHGACQPSHTNARGNNCQINPNSLFAFEPVQRAHNKRAWCVVGVEREGEEKVYECTHDATHLTPAVTVTSLNRTLFSADTSSSSSDESSCPPYPWS